MKNITIKSSFLSTILVLFCSGFLLLLAGICYDFSSFSSVENIHISDRFNKTSELFYHLKYILISTGVYICLFSIFVRKYIYDFNKVDFTISFLIFVTLSLYAISSQIRYFDNDEYEHLHNAWMMLEKTIPFYSLKFTHSPFLEYVSVFFMKLQGESILIIRTMRLLIFLLSCCSLFFVYHISVKLFQTNRHGLLSVLLIICNHVWMEKSLEIRPDNIMVFFALISFLVLIYYYETRKKIFLLSFIICAILSFFGKQNAAVFYFGIFVVFLYQLALCKKQPAFKIAVVSLVTSAILIVVYLVPKEFFLSLGFKHLIPSDIKFWPTSFLLEIFEKTPPVFIFFVVQLFLYKNVKITIPIFKKYLFSISIITFLFLFLMNRPWLQEMLVMIIFMSILGADALVRFFNRRSFIVCILILLAIAGPLHSRIIRKSILLNKTMTRDMATTQTILDISEKNDIVFDAYGKAIFRHHPLEPQYLIYFPEKFAKTKELKRSKTKYLIKDDDYYPRLPVNTLKWFENNFEQTTVNKNIFIRKELQKNDY